MKFAPRACWLMIFLLWMMVPSPGYGQSLCSGWALANRAYYEPLIAEPRAANLAITAIALSDEFPFVVKPGKRAVWDITLGKEIPIWGCESRSSATAFLPPGNWGFGIWLPVSFHLVEDFKDPSAPILNTDYRFSGMVKVQRALENDRFLNFRFQFGHESTHLGDEFSLAASALHPDFERVNVSYEYWEYGISYEWFVNDSHMFKIRHGGIGLLNPSNGFYSNTLLDPSQTVITRSARNFEPYFGFEWTPDSDKGGAWQMFASVDARYKIIYDYHKVNDEAAEDKQWSFNLLVGIRNVQQGFLNKGVPSPFFRFYHGVNPNGQFRTQRDYTLVGVGIHVPL